MSKYFKKIDFSTLYKERIRSQHLYLSSMIGRPRIGEVFKSLYGLLIFPPPHEAKGQMILGIT